MRGRFGILFGFAVLGALCGCGQDPADVEQPVEEVSFGEVVFKSRSSVDARQLSFCLQTEAVDAPEDSVIFERSATECVDSTNFIQKIVAKPLNDFMSSVATKGTLRDDWDEYTFDLHISFKRTSGSSWEHVNDHLYYSGGGSWSSGYYYKLGDCYSVWLAVCSTNVGYEFDSYPYLSVSVGQYASQTDAVGGFANYNSNFPDGTPIAITLEHLVTAVSFTFNGAGPSGRINSITLSDICTSVVWTRYLSWDDYTLGSRSVSLNADVTSGSSRSLLGSGNYLFFGKTEDSRISVSFSPSYGGTYTVSKDLPNMSRGVAYNITLSFPSFPSSQSPYLYFSGGGATDNKFMYVDCNAQTVSVPITTNIDYTDPGTWGLSPSGYTLNMYSSLYANIDVPANLYSSTASHPSNTTYFNLSFDGASGSPQDYVTSSNGLRIYQYGTDIYAGPDYSFGWDFASDYENGAYPIDAAGQTISRAFSHSTYNGDREYITTDDSWIHITDLDTSSGYDQLFSISFDANNTSSSRTGYITCYGSESGQSPYNVSRTYAFSQEQNLTYQYELVIDDDYYSTSVGGSVNVTASVYQVEYQGGSPTGNRWLQADVTSSCTFSTDYTSYVSISGNTFTGLSETGYVSFSASYSGAYGSLSDSAYIEVDGVYNLILSPDGDSYIIPQGSQISFRGYGAIKLASMVYNASTGQFEVSSYSNISYGSCTWTSEDSDILSYVSDGVFEGRKVGTTTVTVTYGGYTAVCSVTVKRLVAPFFI